MSPSLQNTDTYTLNSHLSRLTIPNPENCFIGNFAVRQFSLERTTSPQDDFPSNKQLLWNIFIRSQDNFSYWITTLDIYSWQNDYSFKLGRIHRPNFRLDQQRVILRTVTRFCFFNLSFLVGQTLLSVFLQAEFLFRNILITSTGLSTNLFQLNTLPYYIFYSQ